MGGGTRKGDGRRGRGGVLLLLKQSGGPHCEAEKWTGPPARSTQIRRRGDLERHRVDGALSESMVVQHRHVVGLCDGPQSRFCRPGHAALDVGQAAGCRLDMARGAWRARPAVPSPTTASMLLKAWSVFSLASLSYFLVRPYVTILAYLLFWAGTLLQFTPMCSFITLIFPFWFGVESELPSRRPSRTQAVPCSPAAFGAT